MRVGRDVEAILWEAIRPGLVSRLRPPQVHRWLLPL